MKKAFTLIELLAVIIILAIVALIATPIILDVIDEAERSANLSQAYLLLSGAENLYTTSQLTGEFNDKFIKGDDIYGEIDTTGEKPPIGEITITKAGEIDFAVYIDGTCYRKGLNDDVITPTYNVDVSTCTLGGTPPVEEEYVEDTLEGGKVVLGAGMVPVKISYNENDASASGIVTVANTSDEWYNYANSEWANAVTVLDGTDVTPGTTIDMTNIVQMYVYIPRYKYKVFESNTKITIDVVFESKDSITGREIALTSAPGDVAGQYITHPAFYYEENGTSVELDGIWVGKFEQGTGNKIVPNINSLNNLNVLSLNTQISSMNNQNGLDDNVDVHMIKNMEWGAILYLAHSNYGICKTGPGDLCKASNEATETIKVKNNNYYSNSSTWDIVTGCGGNDGAVSGTCPATNRWNTDLGVKASTTHNVTGIYDMSGGRFEYMMAVGNGTMSSSGFTSLPDGKYYDSYILPFESTDYTRGLLGDGTKEMMPTGNGLSTWDGAAAIFPDSLYSWFIRSGFSNSSVTGLNAGIFSFGGDTGIAFPSSSSRSVVWVSQG